MNVVRRAAPAVARGPGVRPADRMAWIQPIRGEGDPPADLEQLERSMTARVRMRIAADHGVQIAADAPVGA